MPLLTYTDRVLLPEPGIANSEAPSLIDIAVSLSRQPRFGGHTRRWWSVLDHLLFCDELVRHQIGIARSVRLAMLLHDAHEAVTADVPTDAKSPQLRMLQSDLDRAIMDRYFPGGYSSYHAHLETVKKYDLLALVAEANKLGPPVSEKRLVEVEPRFDRLTTPGARAAIETLEVLLSGGVAATPPWKQSQEDHPVVREYLSRMTILM